MTIRRVERIRETGVEVLSLFAGEGPKHIRDVTDADMGEFVGLLLTNAKYLLDAAAALDDAHERICGCDEPGALSKCVAGEEFAALIPLLVDG